MPDFDLWTWPIPDDLRVDEFEAYDQSTARVARTANNRIVWIEIVLRMELPTMNASRVRPGQSRKQAIMANILKKRMQNAWLSRIRMVRAIEAIHRLQRQCAADKVKIAIYMLAARPHSLDKKNLYRSCDELILDPLQSASADHALFNDRESNIYWEARQRRIESTYFDGEGYLFLRFKPHFEKCGNTSIRRYREEILKGVTGGQY